jgi:hypothetical protein
MSAKTAALRDGKPRSEMHEAGLLAWSLAAQ